MVWINPIEMNMDITRNIYEGNSNNSFIATAQKVATYMIVPLALVAIFESILKNFILINVANVCIAVLNTAHRLFIEEKPAAAPEPQAPNPPAAEPPAPAVVVPPPPEEPPIAAVQAPAAPAAPVPAAAPPAAAAPAPPDRPSLRIVVEPADRPPAAAVVIPAAGDPHLAPPPPAQFAPIPSPRAIPDPIKPPTNWKGLAVRTLQVVMGITTLWSMKWLFSSGTQEANP